jgi:hypothetical protein
MGYVVELAGRCYAICYDGLDPVTGRERRRWHPAGTSRADAEAAAVQLTRVQRARASISNVTMTVANYLQGEWLPAKRMTIRPTTAQRYAWIIDHHVVPTLGPAPLRRLRTDHLEELYETLLAPRERGGRSLAPKTVAKPTRFFDRRSRMRAENDSSRSTSPTSHTHRDHARCLDRQCGRGPPHSSAAGSWLPE